MTLRTAYIVMAIQAVVIVGLLGFVLFHTPRIAGVSTSIDRSAGVDDVDEDRAREPRRGRVRAETRAADSRASITATPFVESEDVTFSPDDPVGIMLFGKVTTPDGKTPKDDVHISLEDDETGDWRTSQVKSGAYAISGLRPGTWNIASRNAGYREFKQALPLIATQPRQRLDLVLEPCATLKVKLVTPEGQLLQEAMRSEKLDGTIVVGVVATLTPPSGDLPMIQYAGHDDYGVGILRGGGRLGGDVPKGYSGLLELREGPPVYVTAVIRHVVLATRLVPAGADEAELVVPVAAVKAKLAALKLRLVDAETDAPITKARVEATDRQSGGTAYPVDEQGNVLKEELRPGLLHFTIHAQGYEDVSQYIRLEPGQINELGTIRLNHAVTIEGVVVDDRGTPVQANVGYRNLDRMEFPQPLDVGMSHGGDTDGTFKITGAGRGRGVLIATTKERGMAALVVDTSAGSVANVRLVMKAGTRVVLEPKFSRTERYLLSLIDEAGALWYSSYSGPWTVRMTLPPGSYTLRIFDDKTVRRSIPMTVASTPLRMPLTL